MSVKEDLLQNHKDLNGVFGINDDTALGALAAIEAAGKAGKVIIVGYNATPEAKKAIKQGKIYGDAVQFPIKMGEMLRGLGFKAGDGGESGGGQESGGAAEEELLLLLKAVKRRDCAATATLHRR